MVCYKMKFVSLETNDIFQQYEQLNISDDDILNVYLDSLLITTSIITVSPTSIIDDNTSLSAGAIAGIVIAIIIVIIVVMVILVIGVCCCRHQKQSLSL